MVKTYQINMTSYILQLWRFMWYRVVILELWQTLSISYFTRVFYGWTGAALELATNTMSDINTFYLDCFHIFSLNYRKIYINMPFWFRVSTQILLYFLKLYQQLIISNLFAITTHPFKKCLYYFILDLLLLLLIVWCFYTIIRSLKKTFSN